ncbi:MAG: MarR family transcriptional regulator [Nitrospirota bacterium]|nr:MarR family transcriptional regulator [Nitrospirota bacterium]
MDNQAKVVAEIIDDLRRVFQVTNEHSKRAQRETGVTGPQLWAIKTIAEFAPINVSELARRMYLHPATVVGIIDRLEASGLAERKRSRDDRRVVMVGLTAKGKELVAQSPEVAQGILVKGLERLSAGELTNISTGLKRLVSILGAREIPPQLILTSEYNLPENQSGTGI